MAKETKQRMMMVKTVRKGFYSRIRVPGSTFSFTGPQCPSWCVELDAKKEVTSRSGDMNASDAAAYLKTLGSQEEVFAFVTDGEDRKGVLAAQEDALERISNDLS